MTAMLEKTALLTNLLAEGSCELFREVVAASADAIIGVEADQRIVLFNQAAEVMFQYPQSAILGRPLSDLLPMEARMGHDRHVRAFAESEGTARYMGNRSGELKGLHADGSVIPVAISIQRVSAGGRPVMIAHIREISHHVQMKEKLVQLAYVDPLTRALNRRAFFERAASVQEACSEANEYYTILMMDLDHFKRLNDTHGHVVGDIVLKNFAEICQNGLRAEDIFARWGGEEFIALLPQTGRRSAAAIARRLISSVRNHPFQDESGNRVSQTVSIGAASWHGPGETLDEVINRADRALYAAKGSGRNRVVSDLS